MSLNKEDKNKLRLTRKAMNKTFKRYPLQLVQYMGFLQIIGELRAKYGSNSKLMNFIIDTGQCWAFTDYDNMPLVQRGLRHNVKVLIQDYNNILQSNKPDNVKHFLINQYIYWHKDLKTGKFSMKQNNKIKNDFVRMLENIYKFSKDNNYNSSGNNDDDIDNLIAKFKKSSKSSNSGNDDSNNGINLSKKKKHHHNSQGLKMN